MITTAMMMYLAIVHDAFPGYILGTMVFDMFWGMMFGIYRGKVKF